MIYVWLSLVAVCFFLFGWTLRDVIGVRREALRAETIDFTRRRLGQ